MSITNKKILVTITMCFIFFGCGNVAGKLGGKLSRALSKNFSKKIDPEIKFNPKIKSNYAEVSELIKNKVEDVSMGIPEKLANSWIMNEYTSSNDRVIYNNTDNKVIYRLYDFQVSDTLNLFSLDYEYISTGTSDLPLYFAKNNFGNINDGHYSTYRVNEIEEDFIEISFMERKKILGNFYSSNIKGRYNYIQGSSVDYIEGKKIVVSPRKETLDQIKSEFLSIQENVDYTYQKSQLLDLILNKSESYNFFSNAKEPGIVLSIRYELLNNYYPLFQLDKDKLEVLPPQDFGFKLNVNIECLLIDYSHL